MHVGSYKSLKIGSQYYFTVVSAMEWDKGHEHLRYIFLIS